MIWGTLLIGIGIYVVYRSLRSADGWAYREGPFWIVGSASAAAIFIGIGMIAVLVSWLS
jgi:hypothetical protein